MKFFFKLIYIFLIFIALACAADSSSQMGADNSGGGKGGSMARFAISGNHLYTVDGSSLNIFDVSNATDPIFMGNHYLGQGIETIFPYQNHIFIGTQTGMLAYNIQKPTEPQFNFRVEHIQSCDPVVVKDNYAYVTLRGGTVCRNFSNQLDIIKMDDNFMNAQIVKSQQLTEPYGLGVVDNWLFICEGSHGLKAYDISDKENPVLKQTFSGVNAYDVIPLNGILLMIGQDGLQQYTFNEENISFLSKISVVKNQ
jgi:hypothetical protein